MREKSRISLEDKNSYKSIFKATSLFGGVQVYQILIQVIKSKIIAVLLGPAGVGVLGLYHSALELLKNLTCMGLAQSGVRDVSEANGSNDAERIAKIVTVVTRLVWLTGLLGMIAVIILSPVLSKATFGNYDYTIPFVILSITLLLDQLCAGQKVVLQGLRKLKDLAKATAIGATFGLVVSIPFYYLMGIKGIVPTLVLNSFATLLISWWYSRKIKTAKVEVSPKQSIHLGKQMLVMGIAMSVNGILSTAAAYILRGYLRIEGGEELVGLFQAGFIIINTYVGLVFNAIATDYYPRLATVNKDNSKCAEVVCQQGEIATMLLAPMLLICLLFMPIMLQILYSDKFIPANNFIMWSCLGMMFRLASWLLSYLFVAKAESKLFIYNELAANIYYVILSIVGYKLWRLDGLGIAFAINYILYLIQVYLISKIKYSFQFNFPFIKSYTLQLMLVIATLVVVLYGDTWFRYVAGCPFLIISMAASFIGLNKKLNLVEIVRNRIGKK